MPTARSITLMLLMLLPLAAQKPEQIKGKSIPTAFLEAPWVIGAETEARWQGLLSPVNAPDIRRQAFPGQRLTLAVGAQGKDREALLKGAKIKVDDLDEWCSRALMNGSCKKLTDRVGLSPL